MSRKTLFALAFVAVVALAAPETAHGQLLRRGRARWSNNSSPMYVSSGYGTGGSMTWGGSTPGYVSTGYMPGGYVSSGFGTMSSGVVMMSSPFITQPGGGIVVVSGPSTTQTGTTLIQVTGNYDVKPGTTVEVTGIDKEPVKGVVLAPSGTFGTPGTTTGTVVMQGAPGTYLTPGTVVSGMQSGTLPYGTTFAPTGMYGDYGYGYGPGGTLIRRGATGYGYGYGTGGYYGGRTARVGFFRR